MPTGSDRDHDPAAYGDAFADVYDHWYGDRPDTPTAVSFLQQLAPGGRLLELGVGTGRLAIPLSAAGLEVHGIDGSVAMLERLATKPGATGVTCHLGDLADVEAPGRFDVVVIACNTLFNLTSAPLQARCLQRAAARLRSGGRLVVEAFVPGTDLPRHGVEPKVVAPTEVVLSVWQHDEAEQTVTGQYVTITGDGNRLRPWAVRYARPDEIDAMAEAAGLILEERVGGWDRSSFTGDSPAHVSVYRVRT